VLRRWRGWFAAVAVTLVTVGLAILDLTDASLRRWSQARDFTTSVVAGVLVLLVTVLVVDRVSSVRQLRARSHAVAAQSAIIMSQAVRASKAMSAALDGAGDRDAASDELRTYLMMLLTAAPVLIDAPTSRTFLEDAQRLAAELARTLATTASAADGSTISRAGLDEAVAQLRAASTPLLKILNLDQLAAVTADGSLGSTHSTS
jgi:uncharacterized membrane protein YcjF (UPF0283 family)